MSQFNIHKTTDVIVINAAHLLDTRLTLNAKVLLSLMYALSDGLDYSAAELAEISGDSEGNVIAALNELEKYGYLTASEENDESEGE